VVELEGAALDDTDPFTVDPVADDAECTEQLKAIGAGSLNGREQLDPITARMLEEAERAAPDDPAAEHEYDVEQDGSVRDWREVVKDRAAALSDDEVTVSATVHTITDDDLPFSAPSRLIPSDGAFLNERHKAAPELANLAEKLFDEYGYLEQLRGCRIDYKWRRKGTNSNGKRAIGKLDTASQLLTKTSRRRVSRACSTSLHGAIRDAKSRGKAEESPTGTVSGIAATAASVPPTPG